ncbi:MAG: tetratricopeptide repeat protein [Planctomycetes bacterium]|nr:tetratricopeptide repeat protein [Planctomycetota bacterium]
MRKYYNAGFARNTALLSLLLILAPMQSLLALLKEGSKAPAWELADLSGKSRQSARVENEVEMLIFGELNHPNTIQAVKDLRQLLKSTPFDSLKVRLFLIIGSPDPAAKIHQLLDEAKLDPAPLVLRDPKLQVFEKYDVKVIPSLFLINPDGIITLALSGYPFDFVDLASSGILAALKKGEVKLAKSTAATGREGASTLEELEAHRHLLLARGFERRKLLDLARQKYEEALKLAPRLLDAKLGLAGLQFSLGDLQSAEKLYQDILAEIPRSVEAALGLVEIAILRNQLGPAREQLLKQIAVNPLDARCYYLLAQIEERQGKKDAALAAYKKVATLLLADRGVPYLMKTETKE